MFKKQRIVAFLTAATLTAGCFSGCAATDDRALITINDGEETITYGYGQYVAYYTQALYDLLYGDSVSSDMWSTSYTEGETFEEQVKDEILDTLKEQYFLEAHMDEYGVSFTEEEEQQMEDAVEAFLEANSEDGLKQMHATKEYVLKFLRGQQIVDRMQEAIEAEADTTVTDEEANQRGFSYVTWSAYLTYDDDGNIIDPTTEYLPIAETIATAEDFDAACEEAEVTISTGNYGQTDLEEAKAAAESDGSEEEESSYTGLPYELLSALENLEEGQVTEVIQTSDAIYVARLDTLTDEDATETKRSSLESQKKSDYYDEVYESFQEGVTWEVNESLWKKVRFIDRFTGSLYSLMTNTTEDTEE